MAGHATARDNLVGAVGAATDLPSDLLLTDAADIAPFLQDRTGRWPATAVAVARPRSTAEVASIVRIAAASGLSIVPQGGNTGLVGGCAGNPERPGLLVSLQRMRAIRAIDPDTPAVVAEAGCILAEVQDAVAAGGLHMPLGLGSEGSATIGGLVSTNAGGIRALRHGVMRAQVLGLEVVLPDGRVFDGLRTVLKNNMGYDLKQLFIGAEGTLGIVTAAALRLTPAWTQVETALVALDNPAAALRLLDRLRREIGDVVVACELLQNFGVELAMAAVPGNRFPFADRHPWYVLVELGIAGTRLPLRGAVEGALSDALSDGLIADVVLAENEAQRAGFWRLRESFVDGKRSAGPGVNVDVAVPPGAVAAFLSAACETAARLAHGCRPLAFGHVGDGNVHFSVHRAADGAGAFPVEAMTGAIHDLVLSLGGSICAEHGVGRQLRGALAAAVDPVEAALFATVKRAVDPGNRLNPGVVLGG